MSRIDEALKRLTGAHRESRNPSTLERFAAEQVPTSGARRVKTFVMPAREPQPTSAPRVAELRATVPVAAATARDAIAPAPEPAPTAEEEPLVDVRQLADYAGFVLGA